MIGLKNTASSKGISQTVIALLVVILVIVVAEIASIWSAQLPTTKTQSGQSGSQLMCGIGGVQLSGVSYCNNYLSGQISNSGNVVLDNITLNLVYSNTSSQAMYLYNDTGYLVSSETCCGDVSIYPSQALSFNFSTGGSNYDVLHATTNCPPPQGSYDTVMSLGGITKGC